MVKKSGLRPLNVTTIVHLKEILRKTDIDTPLKVSTAAPFDIEKIKQDHRAYSILTQVSQAFLLHKLLGEFLEHIMGLISKNLPMDRGILMLKEGNPPRSYQKWFASTMKGL